MSDTIIFISAYETTDYSKVRKLIKKAPKIEYLIKKYHFDFIFSESKLISHKGALNLSTNYDYINQKTSFSFASRNDKNNIDDFKDIIEKANYCVHLLHAQSVLIDREYYNIDYIICMNSFLVHIDEQFFQIDPLIFSLNQTLIIAFEAIDFKTGVPLHLNQIYGKKGNYNLLHVSEYQFFCENSATHTNETISEIIYSNVTDFFTEMTGQRFIAKNYSFLYDTLILSNEITDVTSCFYNLINTRELPSPLENISPVETYQYFPQDGVSIITNYILEDVDNLLFSGLLLESIKLHIYLSQFVNIESTKSLNKVIRNELYLENLFFAPRVPIITGNLLNFIYKTKTYQHHKQAIKLKVSYLSNENSAKKNRNSVLLNILLYLISLIGTVGTLDDLEYRLGLPFNYTFPAVILAFLLFGLIWGFFEWKNNQQF